MGTRATWKVKAACVKMANPITTGKSRWLRKNMVTNAIFPYVPQGVTEIPIK
jgi:phage gp16-like protein